MTTEATLPDGNSDDDGDTDHSDFAAWEASFGNGPPLPADFVLDGYVNGLDFLAWQRGFGTPTPNAAKEDGDADSDTEVDEADFVLWETQFGESEALPITSNDTIPIPATTSTVEDRAQLPAIKPIAAITADDVRLLQETREAGRTVPQRTPVVQRQSDRLTEEIRARAMREFVFSGKAIAKSMEFELERRYSKLTSANESTVDKAFEELAVDDLANGLSHRSSSRREL